MSHTLAWIGLSGIVLSVGALGTAIGLNVWSNNVYDEVWDRWESQVPAGSSDADRIERGRSGAYAALGLYIGGSLLGIASIVLVIVDAVRANRHVRGQQLRVGASITGEGFSLAFEMPIPSI